MSIYNSLNKMNNQCNSTEPFSLSLVYDKVFQNSYKANEGMYTVSYNFVNPNYKAQNELHQNSTVKPKEKLLTDNQQSFFIKPSRFTHKNSIAITYDFMNNRKLRFNPVALNRNEENEIW